MKYINLEELTARYSPDHREIRADLEWTERTGLDTERDVRVRLGGTGLDAMPVAAEFMRAAMRELQNEGVNRASADAWESMSLELASLANDLRLAVMLARKVVR